MDYYGNNDYRNYLAHHGILGMKWGDKNGPPYPLSGPAHSPAEKKIGWRKSLGGGRNIDLYGRVASGVKKIKDSVKSARKKAKQKRNLAKARAAKEKARKEQAERERILKTGSAAELYANREKFDTTEINNAINRINMETRLRDLKTAEMLSKTDQVKKVVDTVTGYAKSGIAVYDTYSEIKNRYDKVKDSKVDEIKEALIRRTDPNEVFANRLNLSDKDMERIATRAKLLNQINSSKGAFDPGAKPSNNSNQSASSGKPEKSGKTEEYRDKPASSEGSTPKSSTSDNSSSSETKTASSNTSSSASSNNSSKASKEAEAIRRNIESKKNMSVEDLVAEGRRMYEKERSERREAARKAASKPIIYKSKEAKAIAKNIESKKNMTIEELIAEGRAMSKSSKKKGSSERRLSPTERANAQTRMEEAEAFVNSQLLRYFHSED